MINYKGKRVVVTGGCGALGNAIVDSIIKFGGNVIRIDMIDSTDRLKKTGDLVDLTVDLTSPESCVEAFSKIEEIDTLFNVAGGFYYGENTWETSKEAYDRMYNMNVRTMLNTSAVVIPGMINRGQGAIVNVGALGAMRGTANMGAYIASKSAVMRLTESMSEELKCSGVNVNAVLPSIIDTPANRQAMPDSDYRDWVLPSDLANVICFLGSGLAKAVHGALIPVSGLS